jgi:hypothetical protein
MLNTHNNPYAEDEDGFAVYNNMWEFKLQQSQFDMVKEALSSVPGDGWAVVSASHVPLNQSNLANLALMAKVLNAYKNKTTFTGSYAGEYDYDAITVNVDFHSANGEYIGLDVKTMRTQKMEDSFRHIETSLKIAKAMEEKVNRYDYAFAAECIKDRNYEKLECYVLELIMGLK